MKKLLLLLFVSLTVISCSLGDERSDYHYEILPVESFTLPASFELGQIYTISLTYKRPTDCHTSPSLYFERDGKTRTIAVQSLVANGKICQNLTNEQPKEFKFQFEVLSSTPYIFKFYKGEDANGISIFENVTVPVENPVTN